MTRIRVKSEVCNAKFLSLMLHSCWERGIFYELCNKWVGQAGINTKMLADVQILLPPTAVQAEIVAEIEGYQKIIDGARQVVANYRPRISIHPDWPLVELGEVLQVDGNLVKNLNGYTDYFYVGGDNIESGTGNISDLNTIAEKRVRGPVYMFKENQMYNKIRPYLNKATISSFVGFCSSDMYPLSAIKEANIRFLLLYLLSEDFLLSIENFYSRARIPKINRDQLYSVKIPFQTWLLKIK